MSSREERPQTWRPEPGATSASGGHFAPGFADDPLFDPLTDPLPTDQPPAREPVDEVRRPTYPVEEDYAQPRPAPQRSGRRRFVTRRIKRTIKHVDPISVLKLSVFYYLVLFVVWLIAVAVLYSFIAATPLFDMIEEIEGGFVLEVPDITFSLVEKWAAIIGLIMVVVGTIANVFLAMLYNIGANILGGIEVTFVERE